MSAAQLITVGRVGSVYGVRGWLHINSFTESPQQIFSYQPWFLKNRQGLREIQLQSHKVHGDHWIVKFVGVDDREQAQRWVQSEIQIDSALLPELPGSEFYWFQLEGLKVYSAYQGGNVYLGKVESLMETGANDVLVVKGDEDSVDRRERLIPYLSERVVKSVDLDAETVTVDWDPDF